MTDATRGAEEHANVPVEEREDEEGVVDGGAGGNLDEITPNRLGYGQGDAGMSTAGTGELHNPDRNDDPVD